MEVVLSMTIFLMMVIVFAASFPLVSSQAQASDNSAQAAMMVQHKMDQLRAAGFSNLTNSGNLTATTPGYADPGSASASNVPYTVKFTSVDSLAATNGPGSGYFPAGTIGTIKVQDMHSVNSALGVPAGSIYEVTVTITWPAGGAGGTHGGSSSSTTLISKQGGEI
jgi:type II secretory pathway pseudopilin PulG